ncbi:glycosyltransferase family 4 protein [Synechococcus sp. RSCCF101]|uniref:glycosyltransferase n=1 Tax=Synechococcus sp. RSCCF101 TaxID=2511069 RepID=UPI0012467B13|nr:glycosyltransferase [Synechococcus sp. RSCCF101]QEY32438.1 glycosyltransferase family 4 protein [Synechococcus sp. RSCCF101]
MARVLISIHALGLGGAERVALQWAGWLLAEGHRVEVLVGHGARPDVYALPPGLVRRREPGPPLTLLRLRRLLRADRPDLVLAITTRPAIRMLLAAWGTGIPVLVAERNHPALKPLPPLWRLLRRLTYPRAARHLVQTDSIAAWLRRRRLLSRSGGVAVVPNALQWPLPRHSPAVDPGNVLAEGERLLLAAGTKPHQKGFDRLVAAFAAVGPRLPGWRLVIAGLPPGAWPPDWPLPAEAALRPLLVGPVGNMADWYDRADLFVLSSRYEGFPNVLLEAMASGTACLAADCPSGPAELIDPGRSGWLVPAGEDEPAAVEALAEALARLMADAPLRQRLGQAALEVHQRLDPARVRQLLLDALDPWLPAPPPPPARQP